VKTRLEIDSQNAAALLVIPSIFAIRISSSSQAHNFKRANAPGLPQKDQMNITKNLGMLLLSIYLILVGIMALFHLAIPVILTGILALAAGILILIGK
jgi:hypothetical protein